MKVALLCAVAAGLLIVGACGPGTRPDHPPEVRLGEDSCDHCKMIISEARFAACGYDGDGQPRRFDDAGCLVRYLKASPVEPNHLWIHDYRGDEWLPAQESFLVVSKDLHTAMGSGVVALRSREAARQLAQETNGKLVSWAELISDADPD